VHVFGPEGLEAVWGGFCQMLSFDIALRQADEGRPDLTQLVQLHTFAEGVVLQEEGVTVQALKVLHPPVEEAYAFRFDCGSKAVTFSGDTTYFPPLAEFAKGSSILVHEAMLAEGIDFVVKATGNTDGRLRQVRRRRRAIKPFA
jgi:ribonuclease BN (tRNA processing enzyme)